MLAYIIHDIIEEKPLSHINLFTIIRWYHKPLLQISVFPHLNVFLTWKFLDMNIKVTHISIFTNFSG